MQSNRLLFFVLILAVCLTQFASDIYAPSIPAIADDLKTSLNSVQWSMAIYMLGVAVSQLIYGPISEGIGRKAPMIVGLCIMLIGTFLCLFAPTIEFLILGRLIQGCGAGACASLWRAAFRDIYSGEELAKYGSYLGIAVMFVVPAAPVVGGYLQEYFGWRANFVYMSIYGLVALIAIIFGLPETSKHHHLNRLRLSFILSTFRDMLTHRVFMGVSFCSFLSYGAFFIWFTVGPVLLIHVSGMSPVAYGWLNFVGGGCAYTTAAVLNARLGARYGMSNMLRLGWSLMFLSGVVLLIGKFLVGVNAWAVGIPLIIFYFGATFIWPNAFALAFTPFGKIAGYAGALYGSMQICGAAVLGGIVSNFPSNTQIPLAIAILLASSSAWLIYEFVVKKELQAPEEKEKSENMVRANS